MANLLFEAILGRLADAIGVLGAIEKRNEKLITPITIHIYGNVHASFNALPAYDVLIGDAMFLLRSF